MIIRNYKKEIFACPHVKNFSALLSSASYFPLWPAEHPPHFRRHPRELAIQLDTLIKRFIRSICKTVLIYRLQHCQPTPDCITAPNNKTAYSADSCGNIYAINLQSGASNVITSISGAEIYGIAVANTTTAYAASYNTNTVYSVNLQNGAQAPVAIIPGSPGLIDIALINDTTAIVASYNNSSVYSVNLQTGDSTLVATIAGSPELEGLGLANNTTAYVVGDSSDNVYTVNLETGAYSLVTPTPLAGELVGMAVDGTSGYTVGYLNNNIYVVNLLNGQSFILSTIPGASLIGFSLPLQMQTSGLIGSSESLAKYLNANATIDVIREFALLGTGLEAALESAAPDSQCLYNLCFAKCLSRLQPNPHRPYAAKTVPSPDAKKLQGCTGRHPLG